MKKKLTLAGTFVFLIAFSVSAQVPQVPSFTLSSRSIDQGGVLVVTLSPYSVLRAVRVFNKNFTPNVRGVIYIGIDPETKPGQYLIDLVDVDTGLKIDWYHDHVEVVRCQFSEVKIDRDRVVVPIPQRSKEAEAIARAYSRRWRHEDFLTGAATRLPLNGLTLPGDITDEFYNKRVYRNGSSIHRGVDLRAIIGTPVKAINSGVVALTAKNFSLEGNMVILDHGSGVFSLYLHLSRVDVREGQRIGAGQVVGLSGDTGLGVTGPHLHLAVKVNGVNVDPLGFIETMNQYIRR